MSSRLRQSCWSVVFVANLIMPLQFASLIVHQRAWIGVSLAVAAYWRAGLYACRKNRSMSLSLIIGGGLVALSQVYPLLHILAGSIALHANSVSLEVGSDSLTGAVSGFLATAITGGILLTVATLVGRPFAKASQPRPTADKPIGKLPIFDQEFDG